MNPYLPKYCCCRSHNTNEKPISDIFFYTFKAKLQTNLSKLGSTGVLEKCTNKVNLSIANPYRFLFTEHRCTYAVHHYVSGHSLSLAFKAQEEHTRLCNMHALQHIMAVAQQGQLTFPVCNIVLQELEVLRRETHGLDSHRVILTSL